MEDVQWATQNWLDLLQSVGIVAGLFFGAHSIWTEARVRKLAHVISFSQHHRELWKPMYDRPELARVLKPDVDLETHPLTDTERLFVKHLILHLDSVHRVISEGMFVSLEGLQKDIQMSFALPAFRAVWEEMRGFQDAAFVEFIESTIQAPTREKRFR